MHLFLQLPLSTTNKSLKDLFFHPRAGKGPYVAAKLLQKLATLHFPPHTHLTPTLLRKHYTSLPPTQQHTSNDQFNLGDGHANAVADQVYNLNKIQQTASSTWQKYLQAWGPPP
eukprot:6000189-Amphidinium_carterae.1